MYSDIAHNLSPQASSGISVRVFDSNLAQFYYNFIWPRRSGLHSWFLYPGFSQKVNSTETYGSLWILNISILKGDPGCFQGF